MGNTPVTLGAIAISLGGVTCLTSVICQCCREKVPGCKYVSITGLALIIIGILVITLLSTGDTTTSDFQKFLLPSVEGFFAGKKTHAPSDGNY